MLKPTRKEIRTSFVTLQVAINSKKGNSSEELVLCAEMTRKLQDIGAFLKCLK